ncbi:AEC family transporter [Caulobacter sp. 602-1]|uniref:AEC family transporter n=1 Tax=Caulobacter sp. 602-1 TaxID=2492472 RepID=UPI000F63AF22|nr:AEC family transporter [Caulobacter sp. 602-1]RRN65961.1 AEC family transporter [Caulobacter sp. 602-1]
MTALATIVLPIFALIGAGWGARRLNWLGPTAARELNRFVVWLALPALMFDIIAKAQWSELYRPGFIAVFGLGCLLVFCATTALRMASGAAAADASVDGLTAGYANVGFIGFPLLGAAFGPTSMVPASIASIITVCLLFAVALVVVEAGSAAKGSALSIAAKVTLALGKNPIVIAPIAGGLMLASGWTLPAGIDRFLTLLASAASPAALVSLGLFLAGSPGKIAWPVVTPLVAAKLIGQPAATWLLGRYLLPLPPGDLAIAVILAALPTGTGPYMVADLYQRDGAIVANGVLLSTIVSIATVTVLLGVFA